MKLFNCLAVAIAGRVSASALPLATADNTFHPDAVEPRHDQALGDKEVDRRSADTQAMAEYREISRRNGAYCNDYKIDARNRHAAIDNLLHICGDGWGIDAKALTAQVDDTVAYICNYSGTTWRCRDEDVRNLFETIKNTCGEDGAGFYAQDDWHVNFGVTSTGRGIC
ncbi:hypothetical protein NLG97_g1876 [Lecanicillium saksenae]|uniref:Uncharacterized protein n=1 Tax=Lecanicillium saksenae TaxID=468837 RepID=A0ACC1R5U1_9HYPO|nr:hypothetical protein NLG97_g1876 [Lecanicillium saksenae]